MSISKGIAASTMNEYVVIEVADVNEFAKEVQSALNSNWALAGSAYAVACDDGKIHHFQPMTRRTYTKH